MYTNGKIKKNFRSNLQFMNKVRKIVTRMDQETFNKFRLTVQQRNVINKLMPTGFSLRVPNKKVEKMKESSNQKISEVRQTTLVQEELPEKSETKRSKLSRKISKKFYRKERIKEYALTEPAFNGEDECYNILTLLKKQPHAQSFLKPVDAEAQGVPDYYDIIKYPMDFSTIQRKLKNRQYQSKKFFHDDIKKIFDNSYYFNDQISQVYKATEQLEKYYLNCIKDDARDKRRQELHILQKRILEINKKNEANLQLKKSSKEIHFKEEDLKKITEQLMRLEQHQLKAVYQILNQNSSSNILQIDLTLLDKKKVLLIQRYLCLKNRVLSNRGGQSIPWFQQ